MTRHLNGYGKECVKLTIAVLAKQLTPAEFRRDLDALDLRFGKRAIAEREPGEDDDA